MFLSPHPSSRPVPPENPGSGVGVGVVRSILGWVRSALSALAASCMVVTMAIVFADVLLRYAFNSPLSFAHDLIGMYLMVALFYFGLPLSFATGHHVSVDILYRRLPRSAQRLSTALSALLALVPLSIIAWRAGSLAWHGFLTGESAPGAIEWPTWIPPLIVAAGTAVVTIQLLVEALTILAGGEPELGLGTAADNNPREAI